MANRERLVWESGIVTLALMDYRQTRRIAGNPNHYEMNPLFSKQPSKGECQVKSLTITALKILFGRMIEDKESARYYYGSMFSISAVSVGRNQYYGLKVEF